MWRNLVLVIFSGVVVWDFLTAEPGESAFSKAAVEFIERVREELQTLDLENLAASAAGEHAASPETPAIIAEPESMEEEAVAAPAPVGIDSVFSREAVLQFISEASERTGIAQIYLRHLAEHESAFNPVAEAGTSTAAGLYQFIEQTWLDVFARYGDLHGQQHYSKHIRMASDGRFTVDSAAIRQRILDLRFDPKLSTFLAAHYTRENERRLVEERDEPVTYAELYIAHFLGAGGALKLFDAVMRKPDSPADRLLPAAARANRSFFYDAQGDAVTVAQLHRSLLDLSTGLEVYVASR